MKTLALCGLLFVVLFGLVPQAQARADDKARFSTSADVYAVGDVHGAYQELVALLTQNGLIDEQQQWSGGAAYLVSVGDLLDRGPDSRLVMDLFRRLQGEAEAAGGQVLVVLGNHEVMNLVAEYRDVSEPEIAAFGELADYAAAMSTQGDYGQWLSGLPVVVTVNDTLFVHGGLTATSSTLLINEESSQALATLRGYGEARQAAGTLLPGQSYIDAALADETASPQVHTAANSPVLGDLGPLWYRGNAGCHPLLEAANVAAVLQQQAVRRIVVGHTPTPQREVVSRFGGSVYAIDTGMLKQTYRGHARLLRIRGDAVAALNPRGEVVEIVEEAAQPTDTEIPDRLNRSQRRALAAYRLDRMLGLNMVVAFNPDEDLTTFSSTVLTEASRIERGWSRPGYCSGRSDYNLVSAFDSLVGKTDRSGVDLGYDPRSWQIKLTNHGKTFGSSSKLPVYAQPPDLPRELAEKLQELDEDSLKATLGELLSKKQIKALLKRRDKILAWPITN